jgi:hypothetical protein
VRAQIMLQYVEVLLASPATQHHATAETLMKELNTQDTVDVDMEKDIDSKVRRSHTLLANACMNSEPHTATWRTTSTPRRGTTCVPTHAR